MNFGAGGEHSHCAGVLFAPRHCDVGHQRQHAGCRHCPAQTHGVSVRIVYIVSLG